jgi:hypothetical protein
MNDEPHFVAESYWKALRIGRLYQLLDFGWEWADALKFAEWEILARKKIDEKYGPQAAMFAVVKKTEFPLEDGYNYYLKVLIQGPFEFLIEKNDGYSAT